MFAHFQTLSFIHCYYYLDGKLSELKDCIIWIGLIKYPCLVLHLSMYHVTVGNRVWKAEEKACSEDMIWSSSALNLLGVK